MRRSLVAVAVCLLLAGCGGEPTVKADKLPALVLQPTDLPDFRRFAEGRRPDVAGSVDPRRFGRQGGWQATYRRTGSQDVPGPLVVESTADVFADADGAVRELDAQRELAPPQEPVQAPQLGAGSVASTQSQDSLTGTVRFYRVAFRTANATGSVTVQGFDVSLDDAIRLARAQERRIAAAAS